MQEQKKKENHDKEQELEDQGESPNLIIRPKTLLRHQPGKAGVGSFPQQVLGVGVGVGVGAVVRVEEMVGVGAVVEVEAVVGVGAVVEVGAISAK